jgi:hypothetical protein
MFKVFVNIGEQRGIHSIISFWILTNNFLDV